MDKVKQGHGTKEFVQFPFIRQRYTYMLSQSFWNQFIFLEYNLKNKSTHWEEMKWEIVFI